MNNTQYQQALKRIIYLMDCELLTPEGRELEVLTQRVFDHEAKTTKLDKLDPIQSIKFRMEQLGMVPSDMYDYFGSPSKTSEVLNKKRGLSMTMIRKLHYGIGVPLEPLIQEYELRK